MIKNIVFDLGRVLYRYWPREDLENLGYNEEMTNRLMACIFDSPTWVEMDRGTYTIKEGRNKLCAAFPELATDIKKVLDDGWADRVETLMPASLEFFYDVKRQGFKTYVLSNWAADGFDYIRARDAFLFEKFDGIVVSGYEKLIKPDPGIYHVLLKRYNLVPKETLFIDDNANNIATAKSLGLHGIVFTSIEDCKQQFSTLMRQSK